MAKTDIENTHDSNAIGVVVQCPCWAVEELRKGFRQLELRAKEQGDEIAATVAGSHHRYADKLIVRLGGFSVREPNDEMRDRHLEQTHPKKMTSK